MYIKFDRGWNMFEGKMKVWDMIEVRDWNMGVRDERV